MAPSTAPMYGQPNYDWPSSQTEGPFEEDTSKVEESGSDDLTKMAFWYMMILIGMLISWILIFFCLRLIAYRQKTRNTQQRRVFVGSRQRQLSVQGEPTIFVSPSNLPPPPKYEVMAPPSYDEVMRVYPVYPVGQQPITQPLVHALAQSTATTSNTETSPRNVTINVTNSSPSDTATVTVTSVDAAPLHSSVVTVTTEERRTSVAARA